MLESVYTRICICCTIPYKFKGSAMPLWHWPQCRYEVRYIGTEDHAANKLLHFLAGYTPQISTRCQHL